MIKQLRIVVDILQYLYKTIQKQIVLKKNFLYMIFDFYNLFLSADTTKRSMGHYIDNCLWM